MVVKMYLHPVTFFNGFEPVCVAQAAAIAELNTAAGLVVIVEHRQACSLKLVLKKYR